MGKDKQLFVIALDNASHVLNYYGAKTKTAEAMVSTTYYCLCILKDALLSFWTELQFVMFDLLLSNMLCLALVLSYVLPYRWCLPNHNWLGIENLKLPLASGY